MLNPFRNEKRDVKDALEHFFGTAYRTAADKRRRSVKFEETRRVMPLKMILEWDDYGSWGEFRPNELRALSRSELRSKFGNYRGSTWSHTALNWLKDGVPAIVLVEGDTAEGQPIRMIGDGRGRTSFAVGLGIKSLPVIVLREKPAKQK